MILKLASGEIWVDNVAMHTVCPFCTLSDDRIIATNKSVIVIRDAYPVSLGHTLLISQRHVSSLFDLTSDEQSDLFVLLEQAKIALDEECHPDGYNIGINEGESAGQTVPHLHIHLIPRYDGDQVDPRGGIRWIFPEKADYWSKQ